MTKTRRPTSAPLEISRRDFVNGSLVGAGAALIGAAPPGLADSPGPGGLQTDDWTGYGGEGDYAIANGNTAAVRKSAHLIRDGLTAPMLKSVQDTGEAYDLVVIGGGFSGMGAAYQFHRQTGGKKKCLVLENHAVFGGEARQNEFHVDGYKVYGPQGSNDFGVPGKDDDSLIAEIYRVTGLPFEYSFVVAEESDTAIDAPLENYYGVYWEEERYDTGYFMGARASEPWVINPRRDNLASMPWSGAFKAEMNRVMADEDTPYEGEDIDQWLDSMSYKHLLENVLGYSAEVTAYLDPIIAISMGGVGADVYSAYSAKLLEMPGTQIHYKYNPDQEVGAYSYPGGNTGIFRHIVKYLVPKSITGGTAFEEILYNPIDFPALDRPTNALNIRLNATVIDVVHDGPAETSKQVLVSYYRDGKVQRVKASAAVVAIGGWVAKRIVSDLPAPIKKAYGQFYHAPILVVNVALRNWVFLDKLGISAARWFEGFGNFFSIRRPMITGKATEPFSPDKPIVMTFYVPFNKPGYPADQQGPLGRADMLAKSYADYEKEIIEQMTAMFADYGFKAEKDIAGIVLNRWGHAYISPQPGFHFGLNGEPAPPDVVRQGFGRIRFGHSELSGYMSHTRALQEGARAAGEALALITD